MTEPQRQLPSSRELVAVLEKILDMYRDAIDDRPTHYRGAVERKDFIAATASDLTYAGGVAYSLTVDKNDIRDLGAADARGALGHRVQDRLHVRGRARNNAQDLADRHLLLERLLGLVEQTRVLDCDHRLVGERLDERDLLVVKR